MKRLYFLLPDVDATRAMVEELRNARVAERHIHVLARSTEPLEDLPDASGVDRTDFGHAIELGAEGGAVIGLFGGLVAMALPSAGITVGGGLVLAMGLASASVGALMSGLIGLDFPNSHLERYREAVADGQCLTLVDVPSNRVNELIALVRGRHPDVRVEATRAHPIESILQSLE